MTNNIVQNMNRSTILTNIDQLSLSTLLTEAGAMEGSVRGDETMAEGGL